MLVITKFATAMLLFCFINRQYFVHDKISFISQLINDKTRNFQKLLRYLSEVVTLKFKVCTGGRFASPSFPGLSGFFPFTIFVLSLNNLLSEALLLTSSISSL